MTQKETARYEESKRWLVRQVFKANWRRGFRPRKTTLQRLFPKKYFGVLYDTNPFPPAVGCYIARQMQTAPHLRVRFLSTEHDERWRPAPDAAEYRAMSERGPSGA